MERDELNELLKQGISGTPEIKQSERNEFLGTFRERVVLALTQDQVRKERIYQEVTRAIAKYPEATMLLNGEMNYDYLSKYIRLANQHHIPYRAYSDFESDTDVGLVIAMPDAVDLEHIYVDEHAPKHPQTPEVESKDRSLFGRLFRRHS